MSGSGCVTAGFAPEMQSKSTTGEAVTMVLSEIAPGSARATRPHPGPASSPLGRWFLIGYIALLPVMLFISVRVFRDFSIDRFDERVIVIVLADFLYIVLFVSHLLSRLASRILYRRDPEVTTPLSMTLVRSFAVVATVPTAVIAVIASLGLNVGIRDVLSADLRDELNETQNAALEYVTEKYAEALDYATVIARGLDAIFPTFPDLGEGQIRKVLQDLQQSELSEAPLVFVIDGNCRLIARGLNSYLYYYVDYREPPANIVQAITPYQLPTEGENRCAPAVELMDPSPKTFQSVRFTAEGEGGQPRFVVYETADRQALSTLVRLQNVYDHYLLAILDVSPEIFTLNKSLINERRSSSDIMQQIYGAVFTYSLITLGLALIIVLFMMQFGVMIANRLARPVHRMAKTAQEVADGNLAVRINSQGSDEIAKFSRIFDSMIGHLDLSLQKQIDLRSMAEQRERNFSEVLANVTAGVIGIDAMECIVFMNRSAGELLGLDHRLYSHEETSGAALTGLSDTFPECMPLLSQLDQSEHMFIQDQIRIIRGGQYRDLLVRIAKRRSRTGGAEGYVIAIDDVSRLIQAQEKATWSSVAQQIAHEINNHMTPITMSLSQIESRIGRLLDDVGRTHLRKYTSMITESIEGLIRISREFSDFARLPTPETELCDVVAVCQSVVPMEFDSSGATTVHLETSHPAIQTRIDPTLIRQALVNIIKNAYEGISARRAKQDHMDDPSWSPFIRIRIRQLASAVEIAVIDNGTGFPATVPMGDFMIPFKTYRSGGTGLGLAYVDRIIKGHGGELKLMPPPEVGAGMTTGAMVIMTLPLLTTDPS